MKRTLLVSANLCGRPTQWGVGIVHKYLRRKVQQPFVQLLVATEPKLIE
jgi:hypothetical protein